MRQLIVGLTLLSLPAMALAQGMPGGGGMGGGGMGGSGGGRGGGMHGGRGSRSGGEGQSRLGGRQVALKPISRDKMDKPVEAMFRAADSDNDGTVTIDELHAVLGVKRETLIRDRFKTVDRNGDKVIDEKEFLTWQNSLGSLAMSDADAGGIDLSLVPDSLQPPLGKGPEDAALRILIEPLNATVLANANSNYDKGVTLEELLAYEHKRFDTADADKDGWLSAQELRSLAPRSGRGGPGSEGENGPPEESAGAD